MDEMKLIETELDKIVKPPTVGNRIKLNKRLNSKGNPKRLSCIHFGQRRIGSQYHPTKATKDKLYPRLEKLLNLFMSNKFPKVEYNQILVNFSNEFSVHKDKNNKIDSCILYGLGDYTGGGLNIHDEEQNIITTVDIRYIPISFKNKTTYHSVEPFEGKRYSVITYLI